ncbi:hypothetical protein MXB_4061 [Myxobolus squamalis]|nr:hypothetical protein MXB_4061 [Myxobolus squamalis]
MPYNALCVAPPDATESPYPKYISINDPIQVVNHMHKKGSITINSLTMSTQNNPECWFCLANPNIQKHMIFYTGNYNYATLAKGGLVPHHILLCPISHLTCVAALDEETDKEMQSMTKSIRKMFRSNEKSVVIFERNYHSQHLQLQIVPIPKQNPIYLADVFVRHGKKYGMDFTEIKNTDPLSSLDSGTRLIHLIKGKIPIQFGREVLASPDVLSLRPDRVDWKKCELNTYQETTQATQLSENFKLYL